MAKKYKSEAMAAIHETMESLFEAGAIDKQTMRESTRLLDGRGANDPGGNSRHSGA